MDVSGNQSVGNRRFMAVVIGTREGIDSVVKRLEYDGNGGMIHMRMIRNSNTQNAILSKLQFDGKTAIAFCLWIEKDNIVNQIQESNKIHKRKKMSIDILKNGSFVHMTTFYTDVLKKSSKYFLHNIIMMLMKLYFNVTMTVKIL